MVCHNGIHIIHLIIVRGPLGVGKSTVAALLADELSAAYIPLDDVLRSKGLDRPTSGSEGIPLKNFLAALLAVLPSIRECMAAGQSVIIDACFYYREMLAYLERHVPGQIVVYTLKAPVDVCIGRDALRAKVYGADAARAVFSMVNGCDVGIPMDATKPARTILANILTDLARTEASAA